MIKPHHKVKLTIFMQHVIAVAGIMYYWPSMLGLILAIFCWFVYYGVGISAAFHKMACHKSFATYNWLEKAMLTAGTLSGMGSSIAWIAVHRLHHAYSDRSLELDPYYPQGGLLKQFEAWVISPRSTNIPPGVIKDLMRNSYHRFTHNHYYKILFLWIFLLTIISPWLLVFAWAVPNVMTYHALQAVGIIGHNYGSQPNDTGCNARDNFVLGLITLGEGWQNTHHHRPNDYILNRWDIMGQFIRLIKK